VLRACSIRVGCIQKLYNTVLLWQMILCDGEEWLVYGVKMLVDELFDYYFCTLI